MNTFEFGKKEIRLNLFKFEQAVKKAVWRKGGVKAVHN